MTPSKKRSLSPNGRSRSPLSPLPQSLKGGLMTPDRAESPLLNDGELRDCVSAVGELRDCVSTVGELEVLCVHSG